MLALRMSSGDVLLSAGKLNEGEKRLREWLTDRGDAPLDADEAQVTGHAPKCYSPRTAMMRRNRSYAGCWLDGSPRRAAGLLDKILLELAQACEGLGRSEDAASFYERLARRVMRPASHGGEISALVAAVACQSQGRR